MGTGMMTGQTKTQAPMKAPGDGVHTKPQSRSLLRGCHNSPQGGNGQSPQGVSRFPCLSKMMGVGLWRDASETKRNDKNQANTAPGPCPPRARWLWRNQRLIFKNRVGKRILYVVNSKRRGAQGVQMVGVRTGGGW